MKNKSCASKEVLGGGMLSRLSLTKERKSDYYQTDNY